MATEKYNFYVDFFEAYKAIDLRQGDDKFPEKGFAFKVASQMAVRDRDEGAPEECGWQLYDEAGGIHNFTFKDEETLHYENSIIENRKPPLILKPVEDESEIIKIVQDFRQKAEQNKPYETYPDEKRKWISPVPGVAVPKVS